MHDIHYSELKKHDYVVLCGYDAYGPDDPRKSGLRVNPLSLFGVVFRVRAIDDPFILLQDVATPDGKPLAVLLQDYEYMTPSEEYVRCYLKLDLLEEAQRVEAQREEERRQANLRDEQQVQDELYGEYDE